MVVGQAVAAGAATGGHDIAGAGRAIAATVDEVSQFIDSFNMPFFSKTVEYKQGRKKITEVTKVGKLDLVVAAIFISGIVAVLQTGDMKELERRVRPLLILGELMGTANKGFNIQTPDFGAGVRDLGAGARAGVTELGAAGMGFLDTLQEFFLDLDVPLPITPGLRK